MTAVYPFTFAQLANLVPDPAENLTKWSGHDLLTHANSFDDSARRARRVSDWFVHDHCAIRSGQLDAELQRRGLNRTTWTPTSGPQQSELMDPDAPRYLISEHATEFHHETTGIHGARFAARHYSKATTNDVYLHERTPETTIMIATYRNGIDLFA